jgi:hypothetical protein
LAYDKVSTEMMDLPEYIASRMNMPFAWGANDCMTFSIRWAEIKTGRKLLPDELWTTELEAARVMKQNGGLMAALDAHFTRLKHPNYAKNGDLVICGERFVSVVSGPHIVGPGEKGLVFNPRTEATHAWTI